MSRRALHVLVDTEGHSGRHPHGFRFRRVQWLWLPPTLAGEGRQGRVVSVPSMEWFEEQDAEYKGGRASGRCQGSFVSPSKPKRLPWYKYLGPFYGKPVSIENSSACRATASEHDRPPW